jgi:hypothetical protein
MSPWPSSGCGLTLEAIGGDPQALRLCDGCYQAATGLLAECEDGCDQDPGHTGLCLRDGPDDCQWCGKRDRLREVAPSSIGHLLPTAGESGEGLWHLHFTDGAQGPYPPQQAAWDDWHASARAGEGGTRALTPAPKSGSELAAASELYLEPDLIHGLPGQHGHMSPAILSATSPAGPAVTSMKCSFRNGGRASSRRLIRAASRQSR